MRIPSKTTKKTHIHELIFSFLFYYSQKPIKLINISKALGLSVIVFVSVMLLVGAVTLLVGARMAHLVSVWPSVREVPSPGGTLGISGWGCAAGTLEPLTYTRASSAEFCYPTLE